jgi:transcription elongation GreA/GreB family factor
MNYITRHDLVALQSKRDELLAELRTIGREIAETFPQGSETLHDTVQFEALAEREQFASARLSSIAESLEDLVLWEEDFDPNTVSIGTRVVCQVGDDLREYVIAGHWHDADNYLPYKSVGAASPLGSQLIGKTLGEQFVPTLPAGDTTPWVVISIVPVE